MNELSTSRNNLNSLISKEKMSLSTQARPSAPNTSRTIVEANTDKISRGNDDSVISLDKERNIELIILAIIAAICFSFGANVASLL